MAYPSRSFTYATNLAIAYAIHFRCSGARSTPRPTIFASSLGDFMRRWLLPLSLPVFLALAGCDKESNEESFTVFAGDSLSDLEGKAYMGVFPSDLYTVPNANSLTGRTVRFDANSPEKYSVGQVVTFKLLMRLDGFDGFGTSAGGWVRFSTSPDPATVTDDKLVFGYIDANGVAHRVPTEAALGDDYIIARPYLPLPPKTVGFIGTLKGIQDAEGQVFGRSRELAERLNAKGKFDGEDVDYNTRLRTAADALVDANIIEDIGELTAFSVFTTQSIHETDMQIAEVIRETPAEIDVPDDACETLANFRRCEFHVIVPNFINGKTVRLSSIEDPSSYRLRVIAFLPKIEDAPYEIAPDAERGFPVAIFGHGLTGDAYQASLIAQHTARMGIATIGIDSPQHGSHPLRADPTAEDLNLMIQLFGIHINEDWRVDPFELRDAWRHSAFDKLGLVEAIRAGIDIDKDGRVDLDIERLAYLGASLGAIQGSEFLSLSEDIDAALLAVGGARVSDIVRFGTLFALLKPVLLPKVKAPEQLRAYVVLQSTLEVGDGVNWAPYVLQNRLRGTIIPHIAMQNSIPDDIVPDETGLNLARALGVPMIGRVARPDPYIEALPAPQRANHASGKTIGMLQTDWMRRSATATEYVKSTHDKSPDSVEAIRYWQHAFRTLWTGDGQMELIDPYALPDAPPRP